jgi:aryl-alcohol dehydrogenase (NADP+)
MTLPTRTLGRTGVEVTALGYGAMELRGPPRGPAIEDGEAGRLLDALLDGGITLIDTSIDYGRSEELIGRWLGSRRDEFIIATKCFVPTGPRPWDAGNSRKNIMRALDASLRRLGTEYVDLYQLHFWDSGTPIDETLQALDDVVRSGKVRYIGCSNFLAYQLARSIGRAEVLGTASFVSVQPRYNLLFRENERELFPLCGEEGIAVIPYNPLAGGFLSGKHQPGAPTEGGRFTLGEAAGRYQERYWNDRMFKTIEELRPIADGAGVSMATMAVQWVLANPAITSPIIGASRPDQLKDSIAAVDAPIADDVKEQLDQLTYEFRFGDYAR